VGRSAFEEAYAVVEVAENEFVMGGWTDSIGQGLYDYYVAKVSFEQAGDLTSLYVFIASALAVAVVVLVGLFFTIRRRVNQKMQGPSRNAISKHNA
jgi:hypothetical protein